MTHSTPNLPSTGTTPSLRASVPSCLRASPSSLPSAYRLLPTRPGFTLTEVLVVVAVIVLLLAVSVPLFKALTGNRSVDAASNVLAAALGDARAEAISRKQPAGLFFYTDRASGRTFAAMVRANSSERIGTGPTGQTVHFVDLIPDREPYALPPNVGIQVLDNCEMDYSQNPPARKNDGYIGANVYPQASSGDSFRYGGVILFDGAGHLVSLKYGFEFIRIADPGKLTEMAKLFIDEADANNVGGAPPVFIPPNVYSRTPAATFVPPSSQFGFILYDAEQLRPFDNPGDIDITGAGTYDPDSPEFREERKLDELGLPFLINRYTGALTRGE